MVTLTETYNSSLKGIGFLVAGIFVFSIQDVVIKFMSGNYPVHEIVLIRSLVSIAPILIFAHFRGGLSALQTKRFAAHIVRSFLLFTAYTSFYMALAALPLAETVTLFFSAPLFITILSTQFLHEKIEYSCWIAVAIGFFGVVIMVRPGAKIFDPAALLPLIAALSYAVVAIATRRLGETESGISMAFYPTISYIFFSTITWSILGSNTVIAGKHPSMQFLLHQWHIPSGTDFSLIILLGLLASFGIYFLSQAYRLAPPTTVAPFEYIAVPLAAAWGYFFWQDIPDTQSILAMFLIVGSGIYIIGREIFSDRRQALSIFKIKVRR